MNATSEDVLFFSDGAFSRRIDDTLIPIDIDDLSLTKPFLLLVDDRYFFYDAIDLALAGKRKAGEIIRNYLLVSYPEEMIEHFKLISVDGKQLIVIPSQELLSLIDTHYDIFKKARKVSSPFVELAFHNDHFILGGQDMPVEWKSGDVSYAAESSDVSSYTANDVLLNEKPVTQDIGLVEKQSGLQWAGAFKVPLAVLLITYVFFFVGEVLRLQKVKSVRDGAVGILEQQYVKAGVAGKADPYGLLLFKAKGSKTSGKVKLLPLIEKLGRANGKPNIQGFSYKGNAFRFDGTIDNFTVLEEFKKDVASKVSQNIQITDTKKEGDLIHFSMRIEL